MTNRKENKPLRIARRIAHRIRSLTVFTKFSEEPLVLGLALMLMLILILHTVGIFDTQGVIWNQTYGGRGSDTGRSVQETKDGGYIIVGDTTSWGAGGSDPWLVRTDASGNEQWNRTFGGRGRDSGFSVRETRDGSYILAGVTNSYGTGNFDAWLIKTDDSGNEQWNKTFGGSSYDWGYSVQETKDGGYVLLGKTESYGAGDGDAWLIKTDASGREHWNKTFGGAKDDGGISVQETIDGSYIITGSTESYGVGGKDVWLIKTDLHGREQWNRTFGGSRDDIGTSVQAIGGGGYIIIGGANAPLAPTDDMTGDAWLIKTDSNGTMLWGKIFSFGDSNYDLGTSVEETKDGSYIITGYGFGPGMYAWLIKTDSAGVKEWDDLFDESGREEGSSVQPTRDGGYISTGWTISSGSVDVWLQKVRIK